MPGLLDLEGKHNVSYLNLASGATIDGSSITKMARKAKACSGPVKPAISEGYEPGIGKDLPGKIYQNKDGLNASSYHFTDTGEAYISYSKAPSDWLTDNGKPLPFKK